MTALKRRHMTHLLDALDYTVPQNEPYREDQVENSAGGFAWGVDDWTKLRRFLILGTEGGTYYASEKKTTNDGLKTIERCLKLDGKRLVDEIVSTSQEGIAPKNDYALFALAVVVAKGDTETKKYALDSLNSVARIGTHLFQFCEFLNHLGSLTGRAKRRALAKWYTDKEASDAAYQVVKYRQRNGWTHRDVLRLAHPGSKVSSGNPIVKMSNSHKEIFNWIVRGWNSENDFTHDVALNKIVGFELAQRAKTANRVAEHIREHGLPREAVPTEYLTSPEVWQALLDVDMPLTALIRNLANMTRIGLLTSTSDATEKVIEKITNEEYLQKARIHPINVLFALKTYASGQGFKGTNTWTPVQIIVDALDEAFYKSFKNVEPTNKRILLALDVSGSMTWGNVAGTNLTPRDASAALALVTAATENKYEIVGFHTGLSSLNISPKMRLDTVIKNISNLPFGGTDCSLPMRYAQKQGLKFDAFVILTDSETWAGNVHPVKALMDYRKNSGIKDAKLVVVGMVSNEFSIADPKDSNTLDVVGFSTETPQIISNFIAGRI
jgi:60 kDa SS-A/Ro ribonucleoprotein